MGVVTLACPGPSLAGRHLTGKVIAVNRAILGHPGAMWAAMDYPLVRDLRGTVVYDSLLTRRETAEQLKIAATLIDDLAFPRASGFTVFTATAALVWAATMTNEIWVVGADWRADAPDYDGECPVGMRRGADRFESERRVWLNVVAILAERGIEVRRL